jgi:hypothetical protein
MRIVFIVIALLNQIICISQKITAEHYDIRMAIDVPVKSG